MDPTAAIRAAPVQVKEEYIAMMKELLKNPEDNREERMAIIESLRQKFSPGTEQHFMRAHPFYVHEYHLWGSLQEAFW